MDKDELFRGIYEVFDQHQRAADDTATHFTHRYQSYTEVVAELMRIIPKAARPALRNERYGVEDQRPKIEPVIAHGPRRHRQRIEPPTFDGDILNYHGWGAQWELRNNDTEYTAVEKYQLLKKALTGDAALVTCGLDYSPGNYQNFDCLTRQIRITDTRDQ